MTAHLDAAADRTFDVRNPVTWLTAELKVDLSSESQGERPDSSRMTHLTPWLSSRQYSRGTRTPVSCDRAVRTGIDQVGICRVAITAQLKGDDPSAAYPQVTRRSWLRCP